MAQRGAPANTRSNAPAQHQCCDKLLDVIAILRDGDEVHRHLGGSYGPPGGASRGGESPRQGKAPRHGTLTSAWG